MSKTFLDQWRQDLHTRVTRFADDERMADIVAAEPWPLPPAELIRRVNSAEKADPQVFLRSGASDLLAIVETLADAVTTQSRPAVATVMELGCGVGRLLRHAPAASPAEARIIATDVNRESLDWCRANLPAIEYHQHDSLPPIDSLPASSVDIIYAHSVFTHIPLERQLPWLHELERLLRPGGYLAITFLGRAQQTALLDADQHARLAADGAIQIHPERATEAAQPMPIAEGELQAVRRIVSAATRVEPCRFIDIGSPMRIDAAPVAYGVVCQTIAHQEAALSTIFDLRARRERPGRQDVVVARRRS